MAGSDLEVFESAILLFCPPTKASVDPTKKATDAKMYLFSIKDFLLPNQVFDLRLILVLLGAG